MEFISKQRWNILPSSIFNFLLNWWGRFLGPWLLSSTLSSSSSSSHDTYNQHIHRKMVLCQKTFIKLFMRLWFYVFDVPWLNPPERFLFSTSVKGWMQKKKKRRTNQPTKADKKNSASFTWVQNFSALNQFDTMKKKVPPLNQMRLTFSLICFPTWCIP